MAPPNYILDPRFEAIMLAAKIGTQPAFIVDGPDIGAFLKSQPTDTVCITFNSLFDMCICSWRYGWVPRMMLDAMGMSRALLGHILPRHNLAAVAKYLGVGEKGHELENVKGMRRAEIMASQRWNSFCRYALQDVDLTAGIFYRLFPDFPISECRVLDAVLRCAVEPAFYCDVPMLTAHLEELAQEKEQTLAEVSLITGGAERADLMSSAKFVALLEKFGVRVGRKFNAAGKLIPALAKTDDFMNELLEHEDARIQTLAAARVGAKSTIEETRGARLLSVATCDWSPYRPGNFLPIPLAYGRAHTHRLAGDWLMNMQNLPSGRSGVSKLRKSLVAPPGYVVLVVDSSQIEARMNAAFCGQDDALAMFAAKKDLYAMLAQVIFGYAVAKDSMERFIGKAGVLGLGFRCGGNKFYSMVLKSARLLMKSDQFQALMKIWTPDLAQRSVDTYRETNRAIREMWYKLDYVIKGAWMGTEAPAKIGPVEIGHGYVLLPNGLKLNYADPRWDHEDQEYKFTYGGRVHKIHGGFLLENIIQALARIVTMDAAVRLKEKYSLQMRLQSHDELGFVVPAQDAPRWKEIVLQELRIPPAWMPNLPLDAEANFGRSYGDAK